MNSAQTTPSKPRQNSVFKHLMDIHWVMAALYFVLFTTGMLMSQLAREVPWRSPLYDFHKSLGVLVMALLSWRILVLLRVWWRKYTTRHPKFSPKWFGKVALHSTLYIFMWVVPVSGYFLSNSYKANNIKFFGILLPDIFPVNAANNELGRNLHFWLGYTFLAFVILHLIAQRKVVWANWRRFTNFLQKRAA
jgi:cytochrome b561